MGIGAELTCRKKAKYTMAVFSLFSFRSISDFVSVVSNTLGCTFECLSCVKHSQGEIISKVQWSQSVVEHH